MYLFVFLASTLVSNLALASTIYSEVLYSEYVLIERVRYLLWLSNLTICTKILKQVTPLPLTKDATVSFDWGGSCFTELFCENELSY